MKETWKYWKTTQKSKWEVSDQGNVKRNGEPYKLLEPINSGYYYISHTLLHRIVATLFVPNPENKPYVDHINGNKLDNRAINLRWVTRSENMLNNNTNYKLHCKKSDEMRKNLSKTKKDQYASGKIVVWNKGLTKETDSRIKSKSPWNKGLHTGNKQLSESTKNTVWMNNKTINKRIKINEKELYLNKGFILGRI